MVGIQPIVCPAASLVRNSTCDISKFFGSPQQETKPQQLEGKLGLQSKERTGFATTAMRENQNHRKEGSHLWIAASIPARLLSLSRSCVETHRILVAYSCYSQLVGLEAALHQITQDGSWHRPRLVELRIYGGEQKMKCGKKRASVIIL